MLQQEAAEFKATTVALIRKEAKDPDGRSLVQIARDLDGETVQADRCDCDAFIEKLRGPIEAEGLA